MFCGETARANGMEANSSSSDEELNNQLDMHRIICSGSGVVNHARVHAPPQWPSSALHGSLVEKKRDRSRRNHDGVMTVSADSDPHNNGLASVDDVIREIESIMQQVNSSWKRATFPISFLQQSVSQSVSQASTELSILK